MTRRKRYTVACLAGDGIGPELMGEASRAVAAVSRLYGFTVEEVHVPFGGEAHVRSGRLLPLSTRTAYLDADAVLVAASREPALEDVESELDLRAALTRVRFAPSGDVSLLTPLTVDAAEWTIDRAFALARSRRAHLTSLDTDPDWHALVEEAAARHDGLLVEHLSVAAALPALAFEPERFDVVVSGRLFADALRNVLVSVEREARVVASGRLPGNGPGVFATVVDAGPEIAGQGVVNPSSMLLAAALMLGEGLGERDAAATLAGAVRHACVNGALTSDMISSGVAATTREFTDVVLRSLQGAMANAEFFREAWA